MTRIPDLRQLNIDCAKHRLADCIARHDAGQTGSRLNPKDWALEAELEADILEALTDKPVELPESILRAKAVRERVNAVSGFDMARAA